MNTSKIFVLVIVAGSLCYAAGWLHARFLILTSQSPGKSPMVLANTSVDPHAHDAHGHDHGDISENSLEISDAARRNLGLTDDFLKPIELQSFSKSIAVPAIIVDLPGRTRLPVSAAMTGIVTHVHAVSGEAVQPGDLILELRLTHEDLVTSQKEFLEALGNRDIELKEITRLKQLAESGVLSNKTLLERQYGRDKLDSLLRSQRESLRLHGLTETQISRIESERRLLTEMRITAPHPDHHSDEEIQLSRKSAPSLGKSPSLTRDIELQNKKRVVPISFHNPQNESSDATTIEKPAAQSASQESTMPTDPSLNKQPLVNDMHLLVVNEMNVQKGQIVNAGDLLCTLADYGVLLIEGQAFETEAAVITKAKLSDWKVSAILGTGDDATRIDNLELAWINNEIDPTTRALKFYAMLPNTMMQDSENSAGQRYISWKYRTGQRLQLQVPVESWSDQIVLPIEAVVREGVDSFVFQQNGDHFDRIAVHEKYRDQTSVVIENDGAIYPGDVVALRGAHQMQMALKNKAGGGIDPHAGHSH
jgi:membrane fusion protein, heavy metal efflux system